MRVKRLEIQGFKSFKDKTVIHFDHGITGIVGPNGCGKSNIVDAFFWVMGEQSYKHMRGTGSEDLIFNGSSKYSPLGMAEATLVMETDAVDQGDGATTQDIPVHLRSKEVSVTRRVYRDGEGEYFINGVQTRLKDIHELFMDTGVGAKGYSVIEQGQIGKIVNAKPEERRLLVEEAAGIAKYKARKKESLRKMEATQTNLARLTDVIQEMERHLNSLERQAQKARQYRKYKDELLDKEMTWGRRKTLVLKQKLESLRKDREAFEQELLGLRAELQVAENSMETERVTQLTDSKLAEDLQRTLQELTSNLTREQSALDLSRRRQGDLEQQLQTLQNEKEQVEVSIATEKQKLTDRENETVQSDVAFQQAAKRAQGMDEKVRSLRQQAETTRRDLDASKKELMTGIAKASDLNSRAASLASRAESARIQAERLAHQVQAQAEKVAEARMEAARTQDQATLVRSQRETLQAERKVQASEIQVQEQKLRQSERERDDSQRQITQLKSRLQSLEELSAAHEGFSDGAKAALDWARESSKISGATQALSALVDLLEVSSGFEAPLEGWLEARLEHLISTDSAMAMAALDHIREGKQGRAAIHFAMGQTLKSKNVTVGFDLIRSELAGEGFEITGELSQFIRTNTKQGDSAGETAATMIANVCVVESFAPMAAFLEKGGAAKLGGWGIVSRDGCALDSNGLLRGGSIESDNTAHVLGRKKAISDLRSQTDSLAASHLEIDGRTQEIKQSLDLTRVRYQALESELQTLEIQAAALDRDVHQMNRLLKDAVNHLESSEHEKGELENEAEQARMQREELDSQVAEIFSNRTELEGRIADGDLALSTQDQEVRAEETELQGLRVDEASLRERTASLKRELESGRSLLADRERRLTEIERILERASREREQHTGGDVDIEQKIQELVQVIGKSEEELGEIKDRLEQASAKLNSTLERIKELHKGGDQKNADTMQLSLEIEKFSGELIHLIQNLEEKYGPGCLERPITSPIQEEMTEPVITAEMTAEEEQQLGEEVERLRERIRRLGEVNVMAIEEYDELKKRYDYLLSEKTDLERSIENLQDAIEYINKTSEDRFKKAFEAIADRFERLFPVIFGGGSAKLSLVYPEGTNDILEAGVDILAQPPGKKVSNITLLSGGEKALTAVSLIFAIFLVKPSPFCVLDEVDAPLDDANIGKFNALLREMSAKSQFILITHNKKTMELNDTLYGVTMEEPGVSKMVSVEMH